MSTSPLLEKPSATALGTAFLRALSCYEDDPLLRGKDHLAELFISHESQVVLSNLQQRQRIKSEFNPGAYEYMIARTRLIDELFVEHLEQGVDQIVILGAGFDTRSIRFADRVGNTKVFELDLEATQAWKKHCLFQNQISIPPHLNFVSTSFNLNTLAEDLFNAGYATDKLTLFVWEGVTHYLNEEIVNATLEFIYTHSANSSKVIFDYIYSEALTGSKQFKGIQQVLDWARHSGEPFTFGIGQDNIESYLNARKMDLVKHYTPEILEQDFLLDSNGNLYGHTPGFYCFALASMTNI